MLLHIVARGKIGRSPEADLVDRYLKRIQWPTKPTELPDRGGKVPDLPANSVTVVLDEKGRALTSTELAKMLEGWRDSGKRETRFLIGAVTATTTKSAAPPTCSCRSAPRPGPTCSSARCSRSNCSGRPRSLPTTRITAKVERCAAWPSQSCFARW